MASGREFGVSESSAGEAVALDQFNVYNRDIMHKRVSFQFCDLYRNAIWNLYLLNQRHHVLNQEPKDNRHRFSSGPHALQAYRNFVYNYCYPDTAQVYRFYANCFNILLYCEGLDIEYYVSEESGRAIVQAAARLFLGPDSVATYDERYTTNRSGEAPEFEIVMGLWGSICAETKFRDTPQWQPDHGAFLHKFLGPGDNSLSQILLAAFNEYAQRMHPKDAQLPDGVITGPSNYQSPFVL